MYQIKVYDLSQTFRNIPEKKKYKLMFYFGKSLHFTSIEKATKFAKQLNPLLTETLAIVTMVNTMIDTYTHHIIPTSRQYDTAYNKYYQNKIFITMAITELKYFQKRKTDLEKIIRKYEEILDLTVENCKIINKRTNNSVLPYSIIAEKTEQKFNYLIDNVTENCTIKNLTLFQNTEKQLINYN